MKKSNYNISVKRENGTLIFNSFTNNYVVLPNLVYHDFLQETIEDFLRIHPTAYKTLEENGMIIPNAKDEMALLEYKNKTAIYASRRQNIIVYPTQDCNLKCWYCYESHVPNTRMSEKVMENIIKFITLKLKENAFDELFVTFFGGEPLTDFNRIAFPLCVKLKGLVEKEGKTFSCFFVTNASLIQEDTIEKFKIIKPRLQITLDGNKERHNKVRIWKKTEAPTYEHIMWAIHRLAEEIDEDYFITFRINYDNDTLKGLLDVLNDIKDIQPQKLYVHFERVWQTIGSAGSEQKEEIKKIMLEFVKHGFCVDQGRFNGFPYACPSDAKSTIVVNYDGTIHKCNGRTLSKQTQYGILHDDGTLTLDEDLLSMRLSRSTFEHKECLACKMLPMCMGPCSQKLLETDWKWTKGICSMQGIDTSLSDYLLIDFLSKSLINERKNEKKDI